MIVSSERASRIGSSSPKDYDFQLSLHEKELKYPSWTSWRRLLDTLVSLPENVFWHVTLCVLTLLAIVILSMDFKSELNVFGLLFSEAIDIAYNALYGLHVFSYLLNDCYLLHHDKQVLSRYHWSWYLLDAATYIHYVVPYLPDADNVNVSYVVTMTCYYVRLRRPMRYLWRLNDYHLKTTIVSTFLKYLYILLILRVLFTNLFIWVKMESEIEFINAPSWLKEKRARVFFNTFYKVDKLFLLIGVETNPKSDLEALLISVVSTGGLLLIYGFACAALAITIALYMRPKEIFRQRVRLIVNDLKDIHVPPSLRKKVKSYYKMYWSKQHAVSKTHLLLTYPPSLINTLYTDIYFEAFQKSQILCDLSYQFLSEVAKHMKTIHYSPGDVIQSRNTGKISMFYIADGEVEVVTAENDETPILRFTRGSILNPCGGCVAVASSTSHVTVRAATFCVAHVLRVADLWRVAAVYGRMNGQSYIIHCSSKDHFERVVHHYKNRPRHKIKYKTSIWILKRNLIELKQAEDENGNLLMGRTDAFLQIANCYIMRNQPDASKMDETDVICLKSTFPCILQPSSSLQTVWKLFVAAIALTAVFVHPSVVIFTRVKSEIFNVFDAFFITVNMVDIIVKFSTPAVLENGVPMNFLESASSQLRSGTFWFLCDVLSAVPVLDLATGGNCRGLHALFKIPYVVRTLNEMEDECERFSHLLRFVNFCLLTCVILCWTTAAVHHGYLCMVYNYCYIGSLVQEPYWSDKENSTSKTDLIVFNMYWAVSFATLTSHLTEDFLIRSWDMLALVLLLVEVCTCVQVIALAAYAAIVMVVNTMRNDYDACIDSVKLFLERNDVDSTLRYRFINYLKLCWYIDKAYSITHENRSILFDLPQHVHHDVTALQLSKYLLCIPLMTALPQHILKTIPANGRLFYTSPNEILLNTGDMSNEVYVIVKGFCEIWDPETKKVVSIITAKSHFGDIECFLRMPVYYTVRAVTHVQIFSLSRKYLIKALTLPHIRDVLYHAKAQPEYRQLLKSSYEQFLKYEIPPDPPNRMIFPLLRKHESDEAFLLPFQRLGLFSISRYIFPRFTIRPDGKYLRRYEWFRALCAFLSGFTPSYHLLALQHPWFYYVSTVLDLTAYYDVVQRMLVGYYDSKGILIYHPASTAAHYFKHAFIVDVLACLPLEHLDSIQLYANENRKFKIMPASMEFLLLNRCLQMYRLPKALDFLDHYIKRRDIVLVIKFLPLFIIFLNAISTLCITYSVTKVQYTEGGWQIINMATKYKSWIETDGHNVGYNITGTPANLWLTAFYWVTYQLTTTGYDLFKPSSQELFVIFIFGILASMTMTIYLSVRVLSIRSNVDQVLADYAENMKDVVTFMKREKFHEELRNEVLKYYEYTWHKTGGINYRSLFKLCNQITLRTDAILHIYGKTFHECPILYHCDLSLLRLLGRAVHSLYFSPDTIIIERGDVISEMYFIDYGNIEARDKDDDDHTEAELPRGSVLGNLNNVTREVCPNRFVTRSNVHLLQIDAIMFYQILLDFPSIRIRIMQYRPHNENYIVGSHSSLVMDTKRHWLVTSMIMKIAQSRILKYVNAQSNITLIFLAVVSLLCVFLDVYNAGFQNNHKSLIRLLYILDIAFLPKIPLNLLAPYISQSSRSQATLMLLRRKYLFGEFKYDVMSIVPVELFCFLFHNRWKALALLRLNRIFRVVTVNSWLVKYLRMLTVNPLCISILAIAIWFSLVIHSTTCLWHIIGESIDNHHPKTSWRWNSTKQYVCLKNKYLCSCYFMLATITLNCFGAMVPRHQIEVAFVCILMILSIILCMLYVGEVACIMRYQFFRYFNFYSKYLQLKKFLRNNRVSDNLVTLTKKYTLFLWREARGRQIPHFVETAPQCLRLKIMSAAYMKHLLQIPAFKHCEPEFLRHLVGHFQPFYYDKNMYVVREGEITNSMYFIHKGLVQEVFEDSEEETQVFEEHTHFGTIQGLFRDTPYTRSYKTKMKSQVLTLTLHRWEYLLEYFPNNAKIISKYYKGPGAVDRLSYSKTYKAALSKKGIKPSLQTKDNKIPFVGQNRDKSVESRPLDGTSAMSENEQSSSYWPIDSQVNPTQATPLADEVDSNTLKISRTRKTTLLGKDRESADVNFASAKTGGSSTSPNVKDLAKSASAPPEHELRSLLLPPGERPKIEDSAISLALSIQNLDTSKEMLPVTTPEKLKNKPIQKEIRITSKSEEMYSKKESSIQLKQDKPRVRSRSLSKISLDDMRRRYKPAVDVDPEISRYPKEKRSALSFSDKIATFEFPKFSEKKNKKKQDLKAKPKDEPEARLMPSSSMSQQSYGDVETYIAEQKKAKRKLYSKERKEKKYK